MLKKKTVFCGYCEFHFQVRFFQTLTSRSENLLLLNLPLFGGCNKNFGCSLHRHLDHKGRTAPPPLKNDLNYQF
jgi:hypothetical protein